jgi:hypothetical protein
VWPTAENPNLVLDKQYYYTVNDLNSALYSALHKFCPTLNYSQIENATYYFIMKQFFQIEKKNTLSELGSMFLFVDKVYYSEFNYKFANYFDVPDQLVKKV